MNAYLFWASLGLVAIGIGVYGYPIITILFSIAVLVFSTVGYFIRKSGKPCKLFHISLIDAMYDDANDSYRKPNNNERNTNVSDRLKTQGNNQTKKCCKQAKVNKTFHTTPPWDKP